MSIKRGFRGSQTSLNLVEPGAAHVEHTLAGIFWITAVVYGLVLIALVAAVYRQRHSLDTFPEPPQITEASDHLATRAVAGAMIVIVVLLFMMLISSFRTSRALGR